MQKLLESRLFETILISVLATIYGVALLSKLIDGQEFVISLSSYGIKGVAAQIVHFLVMALELTTIVLLISPQHRKWGGLMVIGTQVLFMAVTGIALAAGLKPECNCFGPLYHRDVNILFFLEDSMIALTGALLFIRSRAGKYVQQPAVLMLIITVSLVGIAYLSTQSMKQDQQRAARSQWLGQSLSDLPLATEQSVILLPQVLMGRAAFIMFFSPSCPHCHNIMKKISILEQGRPAVPHIFIDITGQPAEARGVVQSFNLPGNIYSATVRGQYLKWTPKVVPVMFLVDGSSTVLSTFTGEINDDQLSEVLGLNLAARASR